jgi:hypothetical protein
MKFKIILTENGEKTHYKISDTGIVIDTNTDTIVEPYVSQTRKYKGETLKTKSRYYVIIEYPDGEKHRKQLARWMMLSFHFRKKSAKYQVNHKDGDPSNNNLYNLEWVTRQENMKHAADSDLLPYGENHHNSKYSDDLIHSICKDISAKKSRKSIIKKYGVNGQLIDDIRSGRSHKKISKQYIDKGFVYKSFDKTESIKTAKKICKLIEKGLTNNEIVLRLGLENVCLPNDIRKHRVYKYISKDYNF